MGAVPKVWHDSGFLKSAPTLRELAAKIGVDPDGLEATVARFNGFAATGKDLDFKRGDKAYDLVYADRPHKPSPTVGPTETSTEERSTGKEGLSTFQFRWAPEQQK